MNATPRLALPFISPGQAQKELMHNEALQRLDMVVAASVEGPPRSTPPEEPGVGDCYLVGPEATGAWAGREGCLAAYSSGGWRMMPALDGMMVFVRSLAQFAVFRGERWEIGAVRCASLTIGGEQVVGPREGPINDPAGGRTVDAEARSTISAILSALRTHGLLKT